MGEKTTIEIEKMRELKQHALDTNKTLKQIINEAIIEKINRERESMNMTAILDDDMKSDQAAESGESKKIHGSGDTEDYDAQFDPQILSLVKKECSRYNLSWEGLTAEQWDNKIELSIQTTLELVYDESVASDTIQLIRKKLKN